ncbi:unnamed protein product [Microthlaspi erraticum]|uniref:Uncharacterized protein n=1 Tax=Microthlaspi erraticum TaxID=1685480 RepID=A0A6D2IXZ3_9BRAS|nr:unnamed protein product [Microthlaspi erraticum]
MDQQQAKAGKTEQTGARSTLPTGRSMQCATISSIDPIQQEGVRSSSYSKRKIDRLYTRSKSIDPIVRRATRSIPCMHASSISSRSINPAQMISQPFDLLGANRLDRTAANRIEPKSTPELFRPIFSHCLGYAVFQSFTLFLREKNSNLFFTVWRRFLNPCFAIISI